MPSIHTRIENDKVGDERTTFECEGITHTVVGFYTGTTTPEGERFDRLYTRYLHEYDGFTYTVYGEWGKGKASGDWRFNASSWNECTTELDIVNTWFHRR